MASIGQFFSSLMDVIIEFLNEDWERVVNLFFFLLFFLDAVPRLLYPIIIGFILWAAWKVAWRRAAKFWMEALSLFVIILTLIANVYALREETVRENRQTVYDETSTRPQRIEALEYLAGEGKLKEIDLSPEYSGISEGIDISEINLFGVDLSEAILVKTNLSKSDLRRANLEKADLRVAILRWANLQEAKLREALLRDTNLQKANLSEANFDGADLRWAILDEANLQEANLYKADLFGANLIGTNLIGTDLSEAELSDAVLFGVNLSGADFTSATVVETQIDYSWVWEGYFPKGIPRNWDTTIKPDYLCSFGFNIAGRIDFGDYVSANGFIDKEKEAELKEKIRETLARECKSYVD